MGEFGGALWADDARGRLYTIGRYMLFLLKREKEAVPNHRTYEIADLFAVNWTATSGRPG